jgi:RecA-family ATPase
LPEETARATGKTADLAFGYMGGLGAWDRLALGDDASSEDDKSRYQQTWRRMHPHTVQFWRSIDDAAIKAVRHPGRIFTVRRLSLCYDGSTFLAITLPSGRALRYPFPRIGRGEKFGNPMVVFKDNTGGKFTDCRSGQGAYGGLWTENIVQAISRDLLAEAMRRLDAAGYSIVLHVHDEIVAEVPIGFGSLDEFKRLLTALPDWAEGLPVAAKVREGERFSKPTAAETLATPTGTEGGAVDVDLSTADTDAIDQILDEVTLLDEPIDKIDDATEPAAVIPVAAEGLARMHATPASAHPPATITNDDIRRALKQPAPKGNGHDRRAGNGYDHAADRDGYPHGERDTGSTVAEYIYRQPDGAPYLKIKRTSTKQFPQYHLLGTTWVKGAPAGAKIPYRLPELIKAPLDAWVLICAGEKDAEAAAALGFTATCNPEGERKGAWVPELNAWFAGRKRVAIMEDNDATGSAHVLEVASALRCIVPDIRIVTFRELAEHGDLSDWLTQGHGQADLLARITAAAPFYRKPTPAPLREWVGQPVPRPAYVVPDRIPEGQVFLFSGEGAEGKSTVIQHLCSAVVLGAGWLGSTPRRGPAIYLECEDAEQVLWWRQAAIAEHYGVGLDAFADAGLQLYSLIEHDAILAITNRNGVVEATAAFDWLYELAADTKPAMIAIASVANVFAGNESNRSEVQQFAKLLTRLAHVAGGAVALIAHPSVTGASSNMVSHEGLSGSTQWHNAFRARAVMRTKPTGTDATLEVGVREILFRKNQYGPPSATCYVRWTNGLYLPVDGVHTMDAAERANKADRVFIELLLRWTEQGRKVSANVNPANYAPTNFAKQPEAAGLTAKDLTAAMERLLRDKRIENRTFTKGKETRHYLAVIEPSNGRTP